MPKIKLISCAIVLAAIFCLSNQPASQSGAASLFITEQLLSVIELVSPGSELTTGDIHNSLRKTAHFFIFLLLGILMMSLVASGRMRTLHAAIMAFGICVGFAILDETHQFFIKGRSAELRDVWIDSAGAIAGIGLFLIAERMVKNRLFQQKCEMDVQVNK